MRIIAGKFKGFALSITKDQGTRPLKDMTRESIFNLLIHSNKISFQLNQSKILDLYAGTGSFGLECLSRQAKCVYFVENKNSAFKILEQNVQKLKIENKTKTYFGDVFKLIKKKNFTSKFDLIFCDPPYRIVNLVELIDLIFKNNLLKENGIIILHRNKTSNEKFPDYLNILDVRIYGVSKIIFGKFLS